MFKQTERELSSKEVRLLRQVIARHKSRRTSILRRAFLSGLVISGILSGLVLLTGDAPKPVVGLFFASVWLGISSWVGFSERAKLSKMVEKLERALERNLAKATRIAAEAMIEFEEIEDEGACYAFQAGDRQIAFVCGQDFYPNKRFPNSDFELIEIFGSHKAPLESWIEDYGKRLEPQRIISATVKKSLAIPPHLTLIDGKLEELESLIRAEDTIS